MTARGRGITEIVVGPVHAGIIEPGRFTIGTLGETIVSFDTQFGFAHRGVEHALIGRNAVDAARAISRVCGVCTVSRSWAYARALEDLAGARIDEASEIARLLLAEIERIYNHIFDLGAACAAAGYGYGRTAALGLVERVHCVCAQLTGHRFMFDSVVPGGVRGGMLGDGLSAAATEMQNIVAAALRLSRDALGNDSVRRRFEGTGVLSPQAVRQTGGVGPARRACGDPVDVRVQNPYGVYARIAPQVAVDTAGDAAARFRVKSAEIAHSLRLVLAAFEQLHGARTVSPQPLAAASGTMIGITEGPRGAETVQVRCDAHGMLQSIRIVCASARNWPLVAQAMEGAIVADFPLVNKSFNLCYACMDK